MLDCDIVNCEISLRCVNPCWMGMFIPSNSSLVSVSLEGRKARKGPPKGEMGLQTQGHQVLLGRPLLRASRTPKLLENEGGGVGVHRVVWGKRSAPGSLRSLAPHFTRHCPASLGATGRF